MRVFLSFVASVLTVASVLGIPQEVAADNGPDISDEGQVITVNAPVDGATYNLSDDRTIPFNVDLEPRENVKKISVSVWEKRDPNYGNNNTDIIVFDSASPGTSNCTLAFHCEFTAQLTTPGAYDAFLVVRYQSLQYDVAELHFTVRPKRATLLSPSTGESTSVRPLLNWSQEALTPDSTWQVGVDGINYGPFAAGSFGSPASFRSPIDLAAGAHSWTVTTQDLGGGVATSDTGTFVVDPALPVANPSGVVPVSPTQGSTLAQADGGGQVHFSWTYQPDPGRQLAGMVLQVTRDHDAGRESLSVPVDWGQCLSTCESTTSNVPGHYTWSVKLTYQDQSTARSPVSSFDIAFPPPPAVDLVSPVGGAETGPRPALTWAPHDPYGRVESWSLLIDSTLEKVFTTGVGGFTPTVDLSNGAHTWQVVARDEDGRETASPVGSFIVDSVAPSPPNVTAPVSGSSIESAVTDIRWTPAADSTQKLTYRVVTDQPGLQGGVQVPAPTTNLSLALSPGLHNVEVWATDGAGNTSKSQSISFTVVRPPGQVGLSVDGGAQYTNDRNVTLDVVWPDGSVGALIDNDGGFRTGQIRTLTPQISWTLAGAGDEKLPKTVYLRFGNKADGFGQFTGYGTQSFTDDIILDLTEPKVTSATARGAARALAGSRFLDVLLIRRSTTTVKLKASDTVSGLALMQFAVNKAKPLAARPFKKSVKFRGKVPKFVRVIDKAGNVSGWRRVKA